MPTQEFVTIQMPRYLITGRVIMRNPCLTTIHVLYRRRDPDDHGTRRDWDRYMHGQDVNQLDVLTFQTKLCRPSPVYPRLRRHYVQRRRLAPALLFLALPALLTAALALTRYTK